MSYEKIKEYYDNGFLNKEQVHKVVEKGKITGEDYVG